MYDWGLDVLSFVRTLWTGYWDLSDGAVCVCVCMWCVHCENVRMCNCMYVCMNFLVCIRECVFV